MILIDPLRWVQRETNGRARARWAHMVATGGEPELRAFARALGLKDWAIQRHRVLHYDIQPRMHRLALIRGAMLVATRSLARLEAVPICQRAGCEKASTVTVSYDIDLPDLYYCSPDCATLGHLDIWLVAGQGIVAIAPIGDAGRESAEPR